MRRPSTLIAAVAVLGLALASCGSDDADEPDDTVAAATTAGGTDTTAAPGDTEPGDTHPFLTASASHWSAW